MPAKFTPRPIKENVNVPHTHPLKEFAILLGGLLGLLLALYILAGMAVGFVVERMPAGVEKAMGETFSVHYGDTRQSGLEQYLQGIVNGLSADTRYTVHVVNSPAVNAMALPGGTIVVLSGLVEQTDTENELAFVLGHEIGHFKNHDHLKGFGRTLVLVAMSAALLGTESDVTQFLMNSLTKAEMRFSQKQETAADLTGLELLNARYGHVGGGTNFLEKMSRQDRHGRFAYFFASHPYPPDRIERLKERISGQGYSDGQPVALPDDIKNHNDTEVN